METGLAFFRITEAVQPVRRPAEGEAWGGNPLRQRIPKEGGKGSCRAVSWPQRLLDRHQLDCTAQGPPERTAPLDPPRSIMHHGRHLGEKGGAASQLSTHPRSSPATRCPVGSATQRKAALRWRRLPPLPSAASAPPCPPSPSPPSPRPCEAAAGTPTPSPGSLRRSGAGTQPAGQSERARTAAEEGQGESLRPWKDTIYRRWRT